MQCGLEATTHAANGLGRSQWDLTVICPQSPMLTEDQSAEDWHPGGKKELHKEEGLKELYLGNGAP